MSQECTFVQACEMTRTHIRNFAEICRPLTRLTGSCQKCRSFGSLRWQENVLSLSSRLFSRVSTDMASIHPFPPFWNPMLPTMPTMCHQAKDSTSYLSSPPTSAATLLSRKNAIIHFIVKMALLFGSCSNHHYPYRS